MIARVVAFSARHRVLVLVLVGLALAAAGATVRRLPLDAIPDLSDTQVIVFSRWDRSPDVLEDQVTYPIVSALLGTPRVKAVRGFSDFGYSYVYVLFEDGTDLYWARSRVLEQLGKIASSLPEGVRSELGPDATSVGWIYQYALRDESGRHDLGELRSLQDWFLRFHLQAVPGVAEVAAVGGFVAQYHVEVDPELLLAYDLPLARVIEAVRRGNQESGGRLLELAGAEYMIRGRGFVGSAEDIERIVVAPAGAGREEPVLVKDVARVGLGPDIRRGVADLNGLGDVVGGVVVMRQGENALQVIERVEAALDAIRPALPEGVEIVTVYDRAPLIRRALQTLLRAIGEEMLIVSAVILLFLRHVPSAIVPIVTIPASVLLAFIPLYALGIPIHIMSLAGIAISIGVLVDGAIVEVENAYKRIEQWNARGRVGDFFTVRLAALQEVAPTVFFSLLVIAVAFLPVFTLVDQEGRMFRPLAWSKTLTMALAALLAVTLDPALRMLFTRAEPARGRGVLTRAWNALCVGRYRPEEEHPLSRLLFRLYEPVCRRVLRAPRLTVALALALTLSALPVYLRLGSEFMPPLDEGAFLYMPSALPGISATEAQRVLNLQDRILMTVPEVASVFGKAGRVDSATDPAPFSMAETTIVLKPESEWRRKPRWYSGAPGFVQAPLRLVWPDRISIDEVRDELDAALRLPGIPNNWTMPIRGRIDMLSTGIRTPIGVKVLGPELAGIQRIGEQLEGLLRGLPGTRSVVAERSAGGYFVEIVPDRDALARYGVAVADVNAVIAGAIGGVTAGTTIQGRERHAIRVRYARDFRDSPRRLASVLVPAAGAGYVSLGELAEIRLAEGPSMVRNENGQLAGYVFVDMAGRDAGGYVREARALVDEHLSLPPGYSLVWSGQYENMERVRERLAVVAPLTLAVIALLLYFNTGSAAKVGIVMLAVPFSLIGAVWLLYLLDYQVSIAVWVGMIALMGLDAETGVFMLLFLDLSHDARKREGRLRHLGDLHEAIVEGAVKRVRPKLMTVLAAMLGLLPLMWSTGVGADTMKRVAAPMVGGLTTSFVLELLVYPALYLLWKRRALP